jgi:polyisoprenoid-binding protein YceI
MKIFMMMLMLSSSLLAQTELKAMDGSDLTMKVPYSFGEHALKVKNFSGPVIYNRSREEIVSGILSIDINSIESDDKKLVCHLRESLGLDYKVSDFPDDHVCENNKLPKEGKNSIKYGTITAELTTPSLLSSKILILKWTIHGQEKIIEVPYEATWDEKSQMIDLHATWTMKRSDFNIIVKKFLFIDASDEIKLKLDLKLGVK